MIIMSEIDISFFFLSEQRMLDAIALMPDDGAYLIESGVYEPEEGYWYARMWFPDVATSCVPYANGPAGALFDDLPARRDA